MANLTSESDSQNLDSDDEVSPSMGSPYQQNAYQRQAPGSPPFLAHAMPFQTGLPIDQAQTETAAECISSTNESVRASVFPGHLRETSFDTWLHSSTKEITHPISNGIVSLGSTMASSADG
ncbi:uncharacterized protein LOC136042269 [Artemia franciscana]|uniref:uncharacterized protein LOC136042269 n=1 Tax=Artemia franciscana TaxID=6661 RepID=UPI0032D9DF99